MPYLQRYLSHTDDEAVARAQLSNLASASGIKTEYQDIIAAKVAAAAGGGGTDPTYDYPSFSAAPPPTSVGQTITVPEGTYVADFNANFQLYWKKR
jgi:hypothetical protein